MWKVILNLRLQAGEFLKKNIIFFIMIFIMIFFIYFYKNELRNKEIIFRPELNLGKYVAVNSHGGLQKGIKIGNLRGIEADQKIRKTIDTFIDHCNKEELIEAYNMLDDDCKKYEFLNENEFFGYIKTLFYHFQKHEIQLYDQQGNRYIYKVKLFDDFLKNGLTDQRFSYLETMMTIKDNGKNNCKLSIRSFIEKAPMSGLSENENLRIECLNKIEKYENIQYEVEITNKKEEYLVLQNIRGKIGPVAYLLYNGEKRADINRNDNIVLAPFEKRKITLQFKRIYNPRKKANYIEFPRLVYLRNYVESDLKTHVEQNFSKENIVKEVSITLGIEPK